MGFFDNKKLMFSFLAAVMYLVIASPAVYNTVGSVLGLENYDDHESNDRTVHRWKRNSSCNHGRKKVRRHRT